MEALEQSGNVEDMTDLRVLRRYERWRKSENLVAMGLIDGLNRLFGSSAGVLSWARRTGLTAIDQSSVLKRFLMGRAMGVSGELPRAARAAHCHRALVRAR